MAYVNASTGKPVPRETAKLKYTMAGAKARVVELLGQGYMVKDALTQVDRDLKTYERWRSQDAAFRVSCDTMRTSVKLDEGDRGDKRQAAIDMGFAKFREVYLHNAVPPHAQQWVDVIEGREPTDLHESQEWKSVDPLRVIVNCPPEHQKTQTISIDYVVYRVCCNPAVRIKLISATQALAKQFLHAIKYRLTNPEYSRLQLDFGPEGGFKAAANQWSSDQIYLGRDSEEKDPTIQALGVGGQLYGARADLIILDDCTDLKHASMYDAQRRYIMQEASSRLGMVGVMLVIGTRVASKDVYSELLNPENYPMGEPAWSYLKQPAILDEGSDSSKWVTLWPRATRRWEGCRCDDPTCQTGGPDGLYPHFDGPHLERLRRRQDARSWALVYQQSAVPDDATFPDYAVMGTVNNRRAAGYMGGLEQIPEGCVYIGSMDPATTGGSGALMTAYHPKTHKRYIADAKFMKNVSPTTLKNLIKQWTVDYTPRYWVIEKTGLNTYFTQDEELNTWLAARGVQLRAHYTGSNKHDPAWGIGSMAPLFGGWDRTRDGVMVKTHDPLIELPRQRDSEGVKMLINQLLLWTPDSDPKKTPQDLLMALWFMDKFVRERLIKASLRSNSSHHRDNPYLSEWDKQGRSVVNISDYLSNVTRMGGVG